MTKGLWKGKPMEDLTRQELEDAFVELGGLYENHRKMWEKDLDYLLSL